MPRVNLSTQVAALTSQVADLQRDLELTQRQLQDCLTEKGVLLSQNAALKDEVSTCHDELAKLEAAVNSYAHRCDALEELLAAKPKAPAPKKPAPKPQVPAQPIASPEAHEALRVFGALTPAQRSAVVKHAGVKVVNLGNVLEVQAKWHSRKSA